MFTYELLASENNYWYGKDADDNAVINLYFFWSENCPHCLEAYPDILELNKEFKWLKLYTYELSKYPENIRLFEKMASSLSKEALSIPSFIFCGNLISGYESKDTTGAWLRRALIDCYTFVIKNNPDNSVGFPVTVSGLESVNVPYIGTISSADYSLPVFTVILAGLDAFNPCAFFVLLFLLSFIVHGKSRQKMALIGGLFVIVSGVMYFLFMAAWLNLFLYLGELRIISTIAGFVGGIIAIINIKDYFWYKKGFSLTIDDNKKPVLFERIRSLLRMDSALSVIIATIIFAIIANSYELLCTAGFPMIYTKILTLKSLSVSSYYLYLFLYNIVYVLPLFLIVALFVIKLGARKLTEYEGRVLKLLSGIMMLLLSMVLVFSPKALSDILVAVSILLISIVITTLTTILFKIKH